MSTEDVAAPPFGTTSYEQMVWQEHVGRGVLDPLGPHGDPIQASTDRRWLWHLECWLMVCGTTRAHAEMRLALYKYLCETCEHEWQERTASETIPAHRQCLWCSEIDWSQRSRPESPARKVPPMGFMEDNNVVVRDNSLTGSAQRYQLVEKAAAAAWDERHADDPAWDDEPDEGIEKSLYRDDAEVMLNAVLPQVTTVEELEALPDGTVLVSESGSAFTLPHPWRKDLLRLLPLTVVWTPGGTE